MKNFCPNVISTLHMIPFEIFDIKFNAHLIWNMNIKNLNTKYKVQNTKYIFIFIYILNTLILISFLKFIRLTLIYMYNIIKIIIKIW